MDSEFGITDPLGVAKFIVEHYEDALWESRVDRSAQVQHEVLIPKWSPHEKRRPGNRHRKYGYGRRGVHSG